MSAKCHLKEPDMRSYINMSEKQGLGQQTSQQVDIFIRKLRRYG